MALLPNAILAILVLTATAILLPKLTGVLLGLVFRGVGWLIWRRTRSRREYVIARARSEEEELRASRPKGSTTSLPRNGAEDEDWEKVDSSGAGGVQTATSSENSGSTGGENNQSPEDWDGIIGFFHPFWYEHSLYISKTHNADWLLQQCRRRRRTSLVGSHTCNTETLAEGNLRYLHRGP